MQFRMTDGPFDMAVDAARKDIFAQGVDRARSTRQALPDLDNLAVFNADIRSKTSAAVATVPF